MITFNQRMDSLYNANATTTGAGDVDSAELDVSKYIGNIQINVAARASGTNSTAITVLHSSESGTGFTAIPASALFNNVTGEASTFTAITTAATDETLTLNRQQLKRYVIVRMTGTDIDQNIAITAAAQAQNSNLS